MLEKFTIRPNLEKESVIVEYFESVEDYVIIYIPQNLTRMELIFVTDEIKRITEK